MTLPIAVTLDQGVVDMIANDKQDAELAVDRVVNRILREHYHAKLMASMPSTKEIIIGNLKCIQPHVDFVVTDVMDSLHKQDPKKRGDYGRQLSLMIARREIHVEDIGEKRGTLKVYRKTGE